METPKSTKPLQIGIISGQIIPCWLHSTGTAEEHHLKYENKKWDRSRETEEHSEVKDPTKE